MAWDSPELHRLIKENIRLLCRHFFPQGHEVRHEWRVGNVRGDPGDSLKIELESDRTSLWKDFATGHEGAFPDLLMIARSLDFNQAVTEICAVIGIPWQSLQIPSGNPADQYKQARQSATGSVSSSGTSHASSGGVNAPKSNPGAITWSQYKLRHPAQVAELSAWRGFSVRFCQYAADNDLIGRDKGCWVTPVIMTATGILAGVHKRLRPGSRTEWIFEPAGIKLQLFIIGNLLTAKIIIIGESQWDVFHALDVLGIQYGEEVAGIVTRGSGNAKRIIDAHGLNGSQALYSIAQNDPPGAQWLNELVTIRPDVRPITIPAGIKDCNDWLRNGPDAAKAFVTALQGAQQYGSASLDWFQEKKVEELTAIEPAQIIEGMLYAGQKMNITGGSKQFKSWLLLYIAYCNANGLEIFGCFNTARSKVAIIDFELLGYSIRKRLETIRKALEIQGIFGNFDGLRVFSLRGLSRKFKGNLEAVCQYLRDHGFKVIVFDPMYKMMIGGDENSNSFVAEILERMTEFCMQCDTVLYYVHHHSKGSQGEKEAIDRGSGAGSFSRDGDTLIDFTPHETTSKTKPVFTVTITVRDFNPIDDFVVYWEFPLFIKDVSGLNPTDLKKRKSGSSAQNTYRPPGDALKFISKLETITKKEFINRMITPDKNGRKFCAERRAWEIIKELIALGELIEDRTAHPPTVCRV